MSQAERAVDILLIASHAPDLAGARAFLGDSLDAVVRNLRVRAVTVGLGITAAAAATARALARSRPRAVVMIGTAGVYPGLQYRPFDVLIPARCVLMDPSVLEGRASYPEPMSTVVECHPVLASALQQGHSRAFVTAVASPLAQTIDDGLANSIRMALGCEAENLELYAVAAACRAADIPIVAALGISNMVGSTGKNDWRLYQRDAVVSAANAVATWLGNGAHGIPH